MTTTECQRRYFVSYSGIKLPLNLVNEISEQGLHTRNTYFCGYFDMNNRLIRCEKIVYGEIESFHNYHYDTHGQLTLAEIGEDDEIQEIRF
ncbi:hypothetical protein BAC3_01306 [uncultured bacterium]|nr:hypothetical protein BAC3_01297 [uncultured bacterium]CAG1770756.1 hypothetical protein BAC3_01306 [uncultured bacterium]